MSWIKLYIDRCHERGVNPYSATVDHDIAMEIEVERLEYESRLRSRARIRRLLCGYYRIQKFFNQFTLKK